MGRGTGPLRYYAQAAGLKNPKRHPVGRTVRIPQTFSFIEDPDGALEALAELTSVLVHGSSQTVFVDHSACELNDLCAESVAGVLALQAQERNRIAFEGRLPLDKVARQIVLATGVPKILGNNSGDIPEIYTFPLVWGKKASESANESSSRDRAAGDLAAYFDKCLRRYQKKLTLRGRQHLAGLTGEVIGNAEDHSRRREWWVSAYLRQDSAARYGECHITIFNLGVSLAESLQQLPRTSVLRRDIEALVEEHRRTGWFNKKWDRDLLWGLYALQEGVSRYNAQDEELGTRGKGTADMIQFFQALGQSRSAKDRPRMCVVSGPAYFSFDDGVRLVEQPTESGERRRIIAFNEENDLRRPPNPKYVRKLSRSFPGTLISMRFYLEKEYLDGIVSSHAN